MLMEMPTNLTSEQLSVLMGTCASYPGVNVTSYLYLLCVSIQYLYHLFLSLRDECILIFHRIIVVHLMPDLFSQGIKVTTGTEAANDGNLALLVNTGNVAKGISKSRHQADFGKWMK